MLRFAAISPRFSLTVFFCCLALITGSAPAQVLASFHPGQIWPDDHGVAINAHGGGILFQNGTYYWFGEHKLAGTAGNVARVGIHCYSSTDLYNWKDEGIALPVSQDAASEITAGCIMERPKVLYNARTKKYVMWFHLELKGQGYKAARCGVATSDAVTGPFTYVGSLRPNAGAWPLNVQEWEKKGPLARDFEKGQMARDMNLFQDDDGTAYLIAASEENQTTQISQLSDDYLSTSGKYIRAFEWASEAPAIFKYQGKYYYFGSHCSGWSPNAAMSAVADSMLGKWTDLGNPCHDTPDHNRTTFGSQSTYVLPVAGKKDAFIFMADRWRPNNAIDGRYIWLPIQFENGKPVLKWMPEWNLSVFDDATSAAAK
jgi:Glycosyl hydrolases family 43